MLTSLHIEGFRGLRALAVARLARVNLFVGANQSGKTSLLDAVQILIEGDTPRALYRCQARRNERFVIGQTDDGGLTVAPRLDSMFHGAKLGVGARFKISSSADHMVEIEVVPHRGGLLPRLGAESSLPIRSALSKLALRIRRGAEDPGQLHPVPHDTASLRGFFDGLDADEDEVLVPPPPVDFVTVAGLDDERLNELWGDVALKPREAELVEALRLIEPGLEGLRLIPGSYQGSATEMVVKLREHEERLSLRDMGEGFRRMLGLLLCMPHTRRSEVLVDEIDTGLHYSVLRPMWQTLVATARERDLQVFATTHSLDCVAALGRLYDNDPSIAGEVLVHRIDRGYERTAMYSAEELSTAAERHIEVR